MTGGGSGGHITPLLAVAHELKKLNPDVKLVYIGQRGDSLSDIPEHSPDIDEVYTVQAGKFRRYHSESFIKQLFDIPTLLKNSRDFWRALVGLNQAKMLLKRIKPDVVFIKGGYVGVPVGLAAASQHIKFITHDSDAVPGLANRIIARWASVHAVALPKEIYNYPTEKTYMVGVPVTSNYRLVTDDLMKKYRQELNLDKYKQVVLVTGGGLGAKRLNEAMAVCIPALLKRYKDLAIVQASGRKHEQELINHYTSLLSEEDQKRVIIMGYIEDLYRYSGAADLIVTRAGATSIAELAIQAKACILVPNPYLTSGHQLKNAEILAKDGAIKMVTEAELTGGSNLRSAIEELLDSAKSRSELGNQLHKFAHPDAALELAQLLLNTIS